MKKQITGTDGQEYEFEMQHDGGSIELLWNKNEVAQISGGFNWNIPLKLRKQDALKNLVLPIAEAFKSEICNALMPELDPRQAALMWIAPYYEVEAHDVPSVQGETFTIQISAEHISITAHSTGRPATSNVRNQVLNRYEYFI